MKKSASSILLVMLFLGILMVCSVKYDGSTVAHAEGNLQPVAYVPINITNTQSIATSNPFQVMIQVDSTTYAAYEAADLSNIAFTYSNGTVIPSWLESGNSNSSTDTVYWVKVGSIPATSTVIISMNFYNVTDNMLNNVTTGEAPTLSPSYGEYDNGPNVFVAYGDFMNSFDGWQAYQYNGNFVPLASPNGAEILDGHGFEATYLTPPVQLPPIPIEVEEGWDYNGQGDTNAISVFGMSPFGTSTAVIYSSNVNAGTGIILNNSVAASFDYYHANTWLGQSITDSVVSSSSFPGGSSFSMISFLKVNESWASAGYAIQDVGLDGFGSAHVPTVANGQVPNPFNNSALIISGSDGAATSVQYVRWVIARALPPNDVEPSVTKGQLIPTIPEFSLNVILPLLMMATLLAVIIYKKKGVKTSLR